jgi:Asp-tRNA(Asn)/Glu-tRNA(Gln) amidotransferase B subunit
MQKIIDETVKELIKIIDSKQYSETVALQFVLEELEAGQDGGAFIQQVISNCGIDKSKYNGKKRYAIF